MQTALVSKSNSVQKMDASSSAYLQKASANTAESVVDSSSQSATLQRHASLANAAVQRAENPPRPNNTGLPDDLKNGVESLSGYSLDNVRVHYNSPKPATVQALAFTQGTDIHVAPGQEHALPHEAWHVTQQMAGRVSPTTNINGMPVNDNAALEHEADVMGEKAVQCKREGDELNVGENLISDVRLKNNLVQCYFVNDVSGEKCGMKSFFDDLLDLEEFNFLLESEKEFNTLNASEKYEGFFYDWCKEKTKKKLGDEFDSISFAKKLENCGVFPTELYNVLKNLSENQDGFGSTNRDNEFVKCKTGAKGRKRSNSVLNNSRIVQIPNLIALMSEKLKENNNLKNFEFILGGGSALAVKKQINGRTGAVSENMRDIDMDFQLEDGSESFVFSMERIAGKIYSVIKEIDGLNDLCELGITTNKTIMFKDGNIEISFHYVDKDKLGKDEKTSPSGKKFKVVNDKSHYESAISALKGRLCRTDKIKKAIMDAVILAENEEQIREIAEILNNATDYLNGSLFSKCRNIHFFIKTRKWISEKNANTEYASYVKKTFINKIIAECEKENENDAEPETWLNKMKSLSGKVG